jgi:hypothetical protein
MHILYVDDSGSADNPNDRFFVLGGISIFERGLYHLIKAADDLIASFQLGDPDEIELHGSPMYSGRSGVWHTIRDRAKREGLLNQALALLSAHRASVRLIAVAVDRAAVSPRDPVELAFEEICNRFNLYLTRRNNEAPQDGQRGLIVMDESKHEQPLQGLARRYRIHGGRWGHFRNLAEVPLFVDSRASRLVQLADLVAFATWRKYEYQDGRFFDQLVPSFDAQGGIIHGLFHYRSTAVDCYCVACFSRNQRRTIGQGIRPDDRSN